MSACDRFRIDVGSRCTHCDSDCNGYANVDGDDNIDDDGVADVGITTIIVVSDLVNIEPAHATHGVADCLLVHVCIETYLKPVDSSVLSRIASA